jgi:hypothetical protein
VTGPAPGDAEQVDARVVSKQIGREPRVPWRVATRCRYGYPTVVVSPSILADGTPFPTYAWLTCPWLSEHVAAEESAGATAGWAIRVARDPALAARLRATDLELRAARAKESGGADRCASVGLAGQSDPLGVKCVHAHVALAIVGIDDPIGAELLGKIEADCPDARCKAYPSQQ